MTTDFSKLVPNGDGSAVAIWATQHELARAVGKRPNDPEVNETVVSFLRIAKGALVQPTFVKSEGNKRWMRSDYYLSGDDAINATLEEFNPNTTVRRMWFSPADLDAIISASGKNQQIFAAIAELTQTRSREHLERMLSGSKAAREAKKAAKLAEQTAAAA